MKAVPWPCSMTCGVYACSSNQVRISSPGLWRPTLNLVLVTSAPALSHPC